MSTATVAPASTVLPITTEVKTFYRVVYKDGVNEKDGTDILAYDILNEKVGEKVEKEGTYESKEVVSLEKQSFVEYFANTKAGADELIPDESEYVAMWNRGVSTKQDNKARQWLKQTDEDGNWANAITEAAYDMREDLKVPTNRRLSPAEKLMNEVSSITLTPEMFAQLEAIFAARKQELQQS